MTTEYNIGDILEMHTEWWEGKNGSRKGERAKVTLVESEKLRLEWVISDKYDHGDNSHVNTLIRTCPRYFRHVPSPLIPYKYDPHNRFKLIE